MPQAWCGSFAMDIEEFVLNLCCVGVSVLDCQLGATVAAISER